MKRVLLAVGAALVIVVAAGLVLLGGSGGNSLAKAAQRMDGENMKVRLVMGMSEGKDDMSFAGTGVQSADNSRGTFSGRMSLQGEGTIRMNMRMIRDDLWLQMPRLSPLLPKGKEWVHMVDHDSAPQTLTPSEFADFLAHADSVKKLDAGEINGRPVEHYQGTVNVRDLAEKTGGETAKRFERVFRGRDLVLPIEAWIGEDGRPARLTVQAGSGTPSINLTIDVLQYGVPVHVAEPPASAVIEEDEFDKLTG